MACSNCKTTNGSPTGSYPVEGVNPSPSTGCGCEEETSQSVGECAKPVVKQGCAPFCDAKLLNLPVSDSIQIVGTLAPRGKCLYYLNSLVKGFVVADGYGGFKVTASPCLPWVQLYQFVINPETGNPLMLDGKPIVGDTPAFPFVLAVDSNGCMKTVQGRPGVEQWLFWNGLNHEYRGRYDDGICTRADLEIDTRLRIAGFSAPTPCEECEGFVETKCLKHFNTCGIPILDAEGYAEIKKPADFDDAADPDGDGEGAGGVLSLLAVEAVDDCAPVELKGTADGQVPTWDAAAQKFFMAAPAANAETDIVDSQDYSADILLVGQSFTIPANFVNADLLITWRVGIFNDALDAIGWDVALTHGTYKPNNHYHWGLRFDGAIVSNTGNDAEGNHFDAATTRGYVTIENKAAGAYTFSIEQVAGSNATYPVIDKCSVSITAIRKKAVTIPVP